LQTHRGKKNLIAVADSGVDYKHEFLQRSLWYSDKNKNYGFNYTDSNGGDFYDPYDSNENIRFGHGTRVSGVLGCYPSNRGVLGVIPDFQILTLKINPIPSHNEGFFQTCKALIFGALMGASVINCSWTIPDIARNKENYAFMKWVLKFLRKRKCIPVFAAMNRGKDIEHLFPQNSKDVITVGSVDNNKSMAPDSNYGDQVDIWAPGESTWSIQPNNDKPETFSGTSMATPFVSSVIAIMKSIEPDLDIDEVRAILLLSGEKILQNHEMLNPKLLNVKKAISLLKQL
jgi:subtilisin family serine protease